MAFTLAEQLMRVGMPAEQARLISGAISAVGGVTSVNGDSGPAVTLDGGDIVLTGLAAGTATPVAATDTVNVAIANLQAQIDAI